MSTYDKYLNINEAIITQAEIDVPKSGYDTSAFYELPSADNTGAPATLETADSATIGADNTNITTDQGVASPDYKIEGYLTGDGRAPNGLTTAAGVAFPLMPDEGDYFLRLDYLPNRLFRYNGKFWLAIEDSVRTSLTPGADNNLTQRAGYVNNTNTYTDSQGTIRNERQPLSKVLTPRADN